MSAIEQTYEEPVSRIVALEAERRRRMEAISFLNLAKTQKRISWTYRRWAQEAEVKGDREAFLIYAGEARRLWREAKYHLDFARRRV